MAIEFKLAIGDPKTKRTYKFELKGPDAEKLIGKKIGSNFNGVLVGASGFELQITGGSDKSGFPMVKGISGGSRKTPLLSGGIGYKPKRKGSRRRKTVVGNTISDSIHQINCKVVKEGKGNISELLGVKPAEEKDVKEKEEGSESKGEPIKEAKESEQSEKK